MDATNKELTMTIFRPTTVVTYQLAYVAGTATLCARCVERDDHQCGVLGPEWGQHQGHCEGAVCQMDARAIERADKRRRWPKDLNGA